MAKKNSVSKKQQPVAKKDTYVFKDPSESLWGKNCYRAYHFSEQLQ